MLKSRNQPATSRLVARRLKPSPVGIPNSGVSGTNTTSATASAPSPPK